MDLAKQQALVEHVEALGGRRAQVAVSLERFFDGNDCDWSVGPYRDDEIDLGAVRDALLELRAHPEVHDVRMELEPLEFDVYPDDEWPFASGAAVITTLHPKHVDTLVHPAGTEPSGGPAATVDWLVDAPAMPPGHHYVGVWWE